MEISWQKAVLMLVLLPGLPKYGMAQGNYGLFSPNKQIELKIRIGDRIQYDVLFKGTALLENSTFSLNVDHRSLGLQPTVKSATHGSYDGVLEPAVRQKFATIRENYNELRLEMEDNY